MSDYRTLIDRVAEPARPSADAFERLANRRGRRQRNHRIGTALLAAAVAAAGISGAFLAFGHPPKPPVPVTTPKIAEFAPLWPQYSAEEDRHAQERADAGDPAFTWLLDPPLIAKRFAERYLGWKDASAVSIAAGISSRVSITICGSGGRCPTYDFDEVRAVVTLSRLGRTGIGGIWSVTGIRDRTISIWGSDGQRLHENTSVGADDPLAAVGVGGGGIGVASLTDGPCGFLLRSRQATVGESALAYFGAGADWGTCPAGQHAGSAPGYVMAYTPGRAQPTNEGHHPEPLMMTAVSVVFVPSARGQPLPTPTQYTIELPGAPAGLDATGLTIFDARTNLPDTTWAVIRITDGRSASGAIVQVEAGEIRLRVPNNACHNVNGQLKGSTFTLTVQVGTSVAAGFICGTNAPLCGREPPQSPRAISILGRHFEHVRGPQQQGPNGILLASKDYELPADTCTGTGQAVRVNPPSS